MPYNTPEEAVEGLRKMWKRMRDGGFGRHSSLDDRMIWEVDATDEDSWMFADETIERLLKSVWSDAQSAERMRIKDIVESEMTVEGTYMDSDNKYSTEIRSSARLWRDIVNDKLTRILFTLNQP